eukprot:1434313-Prymnesium_polylepis.1
MCGGGGHRRPHSKRRQTAITHFCHVLRILESEATVQAVAEAAAQPRAQSPAQRTVARPAAAQD